MNKLFKYSFMALIGVIIAGLSSCSNSDYEYTAADLEPDMRVYFPLENQAVELAQGQNTASVFLRRIEQGEKVAFVQESLFQEGDSVHYNYPEAYVDVTLVDPSGLFSLKNNRVKFEEGSNVANVELEFDFDNLEADKDYPVEISVKDSAVQTIYGSSKTVVSLKYAPWSEWYGSLADWKKAGYDASAWPLSETETEGTYTYTQFFSGTDPGLPIYYRESLLPGSTKAQFMIQNWGYGVPMIIDYDKETHQCYVSEQWTGYHHSSYDEDVMFSDYPSYAGEGLRADYPSWYDAETGTFYLNLIYYISLGYFGNGFETFQCDGFYQPDYNVYMNYQGAYKDTKDKTGAIISFAKGVDVASYKYVLLDGTYSEDLADKLAAIIDGDAENELGAIASDEDGMKMFGIEADGDYTVATANYDADGNLVGGSVCAFTYEAPGGAKWESIGKCKFTEDMVGPLFGEAPISYDVEVRTKADKPGIYRMVNPYGAAYPYNGEGDYDASQDYFIDINAADPDGVYIELQAAGFDWGYGPASLMSYGAYYMMNGYDFETVKANGLMGTLKDNVISFPAGGILLDMGGSVYQGNKNGLWSLNLNPANAKTRTAKAHVSVSKELKAEKENIKSVDVKQKTQEKAKHVKKRKERTEGR